MRELMFQEGVTQTNLESTSMQESRADIDGSPNSLAVILQHAKECLVDIFVLLLQSACDFLVNLLLGNKRTESYLHDPVDIILVVLAGAVCCIV